jgi:hypothetical protein
MQTARSSCSAGPRRREATGARRPANALAEAGSDDPLECLCVRGIEFAGMNLATNTTICSAYPLGKYKEAPGHP